MMGRPAKHPSQRQGHHRKAALEAVQKQAGRRVPPIPAFERGLFGARTRALWRGLWRSPSAMHWDPEADVVPLARYLLQVEEWQRHQQLVRKAPVVRGSMDQLRANPLTASMRELEREMRATEEQFGISPRARLSLGMEIRPAASAPPGDDDGEEAFPLPPGIEVVDA